MSASLGVVVHADKSLLAEAVADRLITAILEAVAARGRADIVLTGGSMGSATLAALGASPGRDAIDWAHVDLWWGDERYLPAGDPDRNETQARADLLDALPLDPARVHAMPALSSPQRGSADAVAPDAGLDDAAAQYAATLADAARESAPDADASVPTFDVLMLGVGPDAHIASLFPEHPSLHDQEGSVIGVRGAPKPPATRLSLTFEALCAAREVWFLVSGADKADAVGLALSDPGRVQAPAAGVRGRRSTTWLLDRPAATHVPPELVRPASP